MRHRLRLQFIGRLPSKITGPFGHGARNLVVGNNFPRIVGAGEAKSSTPIPPPPPAWYKQPQFIRNIVNILLLASFANSAAIILSYKSLERDITWKSKERIRKLRETIEKVRRGESIDIRAALGTGDPEMESRWVEGIIPWLVGLRTDINLTVLREIEEEELKFKDWKEKNRTLNPSKDNGTKP
jgi:Family of unknown function (DUF5321)